MINYKDIFYEFLIEEGVLLQYMTNLDVAFTNVETFSLNAHVGWRVYLFDCMRDKEDFFRRCMPTIILLWHFTGHKWKRGMGFGGRYLSNGCEE